MTPASRFVLFNRIVSISVFTLSTSAVVLAGDFSDVFKKTGSSWDAWMRVQSADRAVRNDLSVSEFLNQKLNDLVLYRRFSTQEIETTRFQHYYQGIEVVGSQAIYHVGKAGEQVQKTFKDFDLDVRPSVSLAEASSIALSLYNDDRTIRIEPELKIMPRKNELAAKLVYWVKISETPYDGGYDVVMDAHSGELLAEMPHWLTFGRRKPKEPDPTPDPGPTPPPVNSDLAPVDVYDASTAPSSDIDPSSGAPRRVDLSTYKRVVTSSSVSQTADASARRANDHAQATLSYFHHHHSRDSYDGHGSKVTNVVHIGRNFANAFWDSQKKLMAYGSGDGVNMRDLTLSRDVAGHEMTHGVISATADLVYRAESGALNEAFADIFGEMIEGNGDWLMGEDIMLSQAALRNLRDPASLSAGGSPYPDHMDRMRPISSFCWSGNDYCWVHVNSTIIGHAAYKMAVKIGRTKTAKIHYAMLTQYLTANSGFSEAKAALNLACAQLYDASTCDKAKLAYAEVGL